MDQSKILKEDFEQTEVEDILKQGIFSFRRTSHPILALFLLILKLVPVFAYIFGPIFFSNTIYTFSLVLISSCVDFWFIKNVAGRILLGLRWWNGDDPFGNDGWVFESFDNREIATSFDKFFFWKSLTLSCSFWFVLLISKLISFSLFWGMLVSICFGLNATNFYGYSLCHKEHLKKIQKLQSLYGNLWETFQNLNKF